MTHYVVEKQGTVEDDWSEISPHWEHTPDGSVMIAGLKEWFSTTRARGLYRLVRVTGLLREVRLLMQPPEVH